MVRPSLPDSERASTNLKVPEKMFLGDGFFDKVRGKVRCVQLRYRKGKPIVRWGRKATGPGTADLDRRVAESKPLGFRNLARNEPGFCFNRFYTVDINLELTLDKGKAVERR